MTPNVNHPRGFTLAELVIGLTILTIIGLAVATAATVLYGAAEHAEGYNDTVQTARAATRTLRPMIEDAHLITGVGPNWFILWRDNNGDHEINLSEAVPVFRDPFNKTVKKYVIAYPSEWSEQMREACDYDLDLRDVVNVAEVITRLTNDAHHQVVTLAENVESFDVYARQPNSPRNTFLEITIQTRVGDRPVTLTTGATMQDDDALEHVNWNENNWRLDRPHKW